MPFACPGCAAEVPGSPELWLRRCRACGAWLRCSVVEAGGPVRVYDVEVADRPETRRRMEVAESAAERRWILRWLLWSSVITLGLIAVLLALALLGRS